MRNLLLAILLLASQAFAVTQNYVWRVPSGGTRPGWGTLLGDSFASNPNLPGSAAQENNKNLVVSNTNTTNSLAIVRGGTVITPTSGNCGTSLGEGYSCVRNTGGDYTITFSTAFGAVPICTCSTVGGNATSAYCSLDQGSGVPSTTSFLIHTVNLAGPTEVDYPFEFICIGPRA